MTKHNEITLNKEIIMSSKNVYILLDRSGSMTYNWEETLGSVNGYVEKLENDVNVYMAVFDSTDKTDYKVVRQQTVANWTRLTGTEISTGGSTPLYDAAGKIMTQMLEDNPERAVLVIMTDGQENASKEYTLENVKAKLKEIEAKSWPCVFLGADFSQAQTYATSTFGISSSNAFNTSTAKRRVAMTMLAAKSECYFNEANTAFSTAMAWTDAEKAFVSGDAQPKTGNSNLNLTKLDINSPPNTTGSA